VAQERRAGNGGDEDDQGLLMSAAADEMQRRREAGRLLALQRRRLMVNRDPLLDAGTDRSSSSRAGACGARACCKVWLRCCCHCGLDERYVQDWAQSSLGVRPSLSMCILNHAPFGLSSPYFVS
jgi:hypothetical protein